MKKTISILLIAFVLIGMSCKKKTTAASTDPRVPPDMAFKKTAGYAFRDTTVAKQDTLLFGIIVTKTEDNLTSFNGSVAYDGSTSTTTFFNHHLSSSEYGGYTVDVNYYCRNQTGSEAVTFTIVDRDGNITKKTVVVTVI